MNAIQTAHNLDFLAAPWRDEYIKFKVGTVDGAYRVTDKTIEILAINNSNPGNGHFEDALQWFEYSCRENNMGLVVLELMNQRLKEHLIKKRGFTEVPGTDHVLKTF